MEVDHVGPVIIHSDSKPNTPAAALAAIDNCIRIAALAAAHHLAIASFTIGQKSFNIGF